MRSRSPIVLAAMAFSLVACSTIGGGGGKGGSPSPGSDVSFSPTPPTPEYGSQLPTTPPLVSATPGDALDGRTFVSVSAQNGREPRHLVAGTSIQLRFALANLTAWAGCNTMSGAYHVDSGRLVLGPVATTAMGCPDNLRMQDDWLSSLITSMPTVEVEANDLVLASARTIVNLVDIRVALPNQPLKEITWGLTTIVHGDVAQSVPAGVMSTLLFEKDGQVRIDFGCNSGGGQYSVDGDALRFSDIVSTAMACAGERDDVNSAVWKFFNSGSFTFSIQGRTLRLQSGRDELQYGAAVDVGN